MALLTVEEMRVLEGAQIVSGRVTGRELMERAGVGAVDAILAEWPRFATTPHRAVVLCGPGNNGGDGFVVARLLHARGWQVETFLWGEVTALPADARHNAERWLEHGPIHDALGQACGTALSPFGDGEVAQGLPDLCIDALFGIGLGRRSDALDRLVGRVNRLWNYDPVPRIVSLDIQSGLHAGTGRALLDEGGFDPWAGAVAAHLVLPFHALKPGHVLADGAVMAERLRIVDIGLPSREDCAVQLAGPPRGRKARTGHKYTHGHALILAGGVGKGGAARLAARGALRIGSGLVTVAPPPAALIENAAQLNAIMLNAVKDAEALAELLRDERINGLCLGPGLGIERARALVPAALEANRATVLDADALTAFADDPQALFAQLHKNCVLTPHLGEFGRLFPDIKAKLDAIPTKGPAYSKVDAARDAAARAGCTILLKGPDTVIADPKGRTSVNASVYERAAPWLATAGSGDVLAGFITGLLARGFSAHDAAASAAWLHTECALKFGPGLIAEDLPETLPAVLADLDANSP